MSDINKIEDLSFEEAIDVVKTQAVFLLNGWDWEDGSNEDVVNAFNSLAIIATTLNHMSDQMVAKNASLDRYKDRCLKLIKEKNESLMDLGVGKEA